MPELQEVAVIQGMTFANIKPKDKKSKYRGKSMFIRIPKNITEEEGKMIQKEAESLFAKILGEPVYVNLTIIKEGNK